MSVLDPKQDVAALQPLVDEETHAVMDALVAKVVPALQTAIENALDGLTITTTVSRKAAP